MMQVTDMPTVVPRSDLDREDFNNKLNEIVGLRYAVQSAQDSEKMLIESLVTNHMDQNPDDEKTVVKKMIKGLVDEHVKCSISTRAGIDESILADYETVKKNLKQ